MKKVTILAVGDILMWQEQINSALIDKDKYNFEPMFQYVKPYLNSADLTIGNLETTLSGREKIYQKKNSKTNYPMFNAPDELAPALKKAGFNLLITANNHCMDRGVNGIIRTLDVLDKNKLLHTGTFRSKEEASPLIINVNEVKIGIIAYTYGTNFLPVPKDKPWLVNVINEEKILKDIKVIRDKVDLLIAYLHFGSEFKRFPNERQKKFANKLFVHGVDIIFGDHPHVLQPIVRKKVKLLNGEEKEVFIIYSLGNFFSKKMWNNIYTLVGSMVKLTLEERKPNKLEIKNVEIIPTFSYRSVLAKQKENYQIIPLEKLIKSPKLNSDKREFFKKLLLETKEHLYKNVNPSL